MRRETVARTATEIPASWGVVCAAWRWRIVKSATTKTSRSVTPMYSARTRAASASVFRLADEE